MKIKNNLIVVLMCLIAIFCTSCTSTENIYEITDVVEDVNELVELVEIKSISTNEDAHTLYQEFIEHLTNEIRWNTQNKMVLELSEEAENELEKLQENKFYNVSLISTYIANRMAETINFNYAFVDVDNNGIDELFLLENEYMVEFFHIDNGEIKSLISSTGWKSFANFLNNSKFYYYNDEIGTDSTYLMYEFTDNELILTECFIKRGYSQYDDFFAFNLPAVDGEIPFFNDTFSSNFIENQEFEGYWLDEQGEQEYDDIIADTYMFDMFYPINYD